MRRHIPKISTDTAYANDMWLLSLCKKSGIFFHGMTGSGKDAIMAHIIAMWRGAHYSNIKYNRKTEVIDLSELNVGGNTYGDFLEGTLTPFDRRFRPKSLIAISDGGACLPAHLDAELSAKYPGMPLFFAMRRHLGDLCTVVNCQTIDRLWKKVREHFEHFMHMLGTEKTAGGLLVQGIYYNQRASAEAGLSPPTGLKGTRREEYERAHGEISERIFFVPYRHLKYDDHYFGGLLLKNLGGTHRYLEGMQNEDG